jgi:hypothetical protein
MMRLGIWGLVPAAVAVLCLASPSGLAQEAAESPEPEMVQLNFPANMDVKLLVDYVGARMGLKASPAAMLYVWRPGTAAGSGSRLRG